MTKGKMQATVRKSKKLDGALKRPLSAYNIFFQEERKRLLHQLAKKQNASSEDLAEWLRAGRDLPHRKRHGMISFKELVKTVSSNWKNLAATEKDEYKKIAATERLKYLAEVERWKRDQEDLNFSTQKTLDQQDVSSPMQAKSSVILSNKKSVVAMNPAPTSLIDMCETSGYSQASTTFCPSILFDSPNPDQSSLDYPTTSLTNDPNMYDNSLSFEMNGEQNNVQAVKILENIAELMGLVDQAVSLLGVCKQTDRPACDDVSPVFLKETQSYVQNQYLDAAPYSLNDMNMENFTLQWDDESKKLLRSTFLH